MKQIRNPNGGMSITREGCKALVSYTTLQVAAAYRVVGYVRNLHDGRVYLVAEGEPRELDRFLAAITARLGQYIRGTEELRRPATGGFSGFTIRP